MSWVSIPCRCVSVILPISSPPIRHHQHGHRSHRCRWFSHCSLNTIGALSMFYNPTYLLYWPPPSDRDTVQKLEIKLLWSLMIPALLHLSLLLLFFLHVPTLSLGPTWSPQIFLYQVQSHLFHVACMILDRTLPLTIFRHLFGWASVHQPAFLIVKIVS